LCSQINAFNRVALEGKYGGAHHLEILESNASYQFHAFLETCFHRATVS